MLNDLAIIEPPGAEPVAEPATDPATEPPASLAERIDELTARSQLYRLLAGVFVEEAGVEFLAALRSPESLAALAEAGLAFDADFLRPDLATLADQLAIEYTNLFIATGGFPPVESVRLAGRYQQDPYHRARQTYRECGFAVAAGRHQVFEDQLGVELMFVAELLERSIAALQAGDENAYRKTEREIKRFWTLHLGKWARGFARLVLRAAEQSYYREMARLLLDFAEQEVELLKLRVDDLDGGRIDLVKSDIKLEFDPDEPVCGACPGASPRAALQP